MKKLIGLFAQPWIYCDIPIFGVKFGNPQQAVLPP